MTKPAVLFRCTHNAGRSQMAMRFFKHLAGEQASVYSGGSESAGAVNPEQLPFFMLHARPASGYSRRPGASSATARACTRFASTSSPASARS
jgi:protein-tyrosine-phosphatase